MPFKIASLRLFFFFCMQQFSFGRKVNTKFVFEARKKPYFTVSSNCFWKKMVLSWLAEGSGLVVFKHLENPQ